MGLCPEGLFALRVIYPEREIVLDSNEIPCEKGLVFQAKKTCKEAKGLCPLQIIK